MVSVLYTPGGGGGGEGGKVENHVTALISWLWRRGEGMTGNSCPGFFTCTYDVYNTSAGVFFACLPFCKTTSLDKKWIYTIRTTPSIYLSSTLWKKVSNFPTPAGMSLTILSLAGNNQIIPARESLVSNIPAGDGKTLNLIIPCQGEFGKWHRRWGRENAKLDYSPPGRVW